MKKGFTVREKVLLGILGVIVVCALYYYLFYIPTISEIDLLRQENVVLEDQILAAKTQVHKMEQMEKELEEILNNDASTVTSLPKYDNSRAVMNELSEILSIAQEYEIEFGKIEEEKDSNIVRRNAHISFVAMKYESVKVILERISNSKNRCLITNMDYILASGVYSIMVDVTYYEYKE